MQIRVALCALVVFMASGCATIKQPEPTGFLSDYSNLTQIADDHLFYSAGKSAGYRQFIVEPVTLLFTPDQNAAFNGNELEELQLYFEEKLKDALTRDDGYSLATEPGPGVARLRVGLVDVERTVGALNIWLVTKVTGAGIGGASAEGEMVDSQTGEQLAATVRWGGGSRVLIAGLTSMGDAKIAIKRWTRDVRSMLDEAHGVSP